MTFLLQNLFSFRLTPLISLSFLHFPPRVNFRRVRFCSSKNPFTPAQVAELNRMLKDHTDLTQAAPRTFPYYPNQPTYPMYSFPDQTQYSMGVYPRTESYTMPSVSSFSGSQSSVSQAPLELKPALPSNPLPPVSVNNLDYNPEQVLRDLKFLNNYDDDTALMVSLLQRFLAEHCGIRFASNWSSKKQFTKGEFVMGLITKPDIFKLEWTCGSPSSLKIKSFETLQECLHIHLNQYAKTYLRILIALFEKPKDTLLFELKNYFCEKTPFFVKKNPSHYYSEDLLQLEFNKRNVNDNVITLSQYKKTRIQSYLDKLVIDIMRIAISSYHGSEPNLVAARFYVKQTPLPSYAYVITSIRQSVEVILQKKEAKKLANKKTDVSEQIVPLASSN